jgi:hypothetical protein
MNAAMGQEVPPTSSETASIVMSHAFLPWTGLTVARSVLRWSQVAHDVAPDDKVTLYHVDEASCMLPRDRGACLPVGGHYSPRNPKPPPLSVICGNRCTTPNGNHYGLAALQSDSSSNRPGAGWSGFRLSSHPLNITAVRTGRDFRFAYNTPGDRMVNCFGVLNLRGLLACRSSTAGAQESVRLTITHLCTVHIRRKE